MITKVVVSKQDIEDAIDSALEAFSDLHHRKPSSVVLGRLAYEELRDMSILGHRNDPGNQVMTHYKSLEITVVEEPEDLLAIGTKPD